MVSCRDHCNPILIPPISRGAGASERATGGERQTVRKRHGDVKSSEGEIISPPCTVYPPQSISSLSSLPSSCGEKAATSPLSLSLSHTRLSHSYLFSPPSLVLSPSSPTVLYSRHAAFSRWSNSSAAATSRPFSPRQPSISY